MGIDSKTVKRVANLARIHVTNEELEPLANELSTIIEFMQQLNAVDVSDVEPLTSVTPMELNLREDIVTDGKKPNEILMNSVNHKDGFFSVPKVIE